MFSIGYLIWAAIAAAVTIVMGLFFNRRPQVGWAVLMFCLFYIYSWLTLPALALDMAESWVELLFITCAAAAFTWLSADHEKPGTLLVPGSIFFALVIGLFATSSVFNAQRMATVITVNDHGQKDTQVELVSQEKALRVTANLALKRGAELMGGAKTPSLASVAQYGEVYGNVTSDGKAVWMAPLVHSGFWRWVSNGTTPGYLVVSHTNVTDSRLVEDQPINYGDDHFYFGHNLERHLYVNGYINYAYGDAFFQVDDEGVPHFVVPLERPQVGFYSFFPEKWAVVNATTGTIQEVGEASKLPEWIDRAYSQSIMQARFDDWGCLSGGWWACNVSSVDVIESTPGMVVTMDSDDSMIYVTGTQFAATKDTSEGATSGVATINPRTGVIDFYNRSGITETAAVQIMNGAVSNYAGWDAEKPVLIHVNGHETYFSVITDGSGARKSYGMVWQSSRDVYGVDETVEGAMRKFLRSYRANNSQDAFEGNSDIDPTYFEGLVLSIAPVSRDGNTIFYVRLDTVDEKVFVFSELDSAEIAVTLAGEPVRIGAYNTEPGLIDVDTFDNLLVALTESELQQTMDVDARSVLDRYESGVDLQNATARLNALTPEQVDELLKTIENN